MHFLLWALLPVMGAATVKSDEEVLFYPGYGWQAEAEKPWTVAIHGVVFEPETDSLKRALLIAGVRRALDVETGSAEADCLDRRLHAFMVDHERGKQLGVRIGAETHQLGPTDAYGYFSTQIELPVAEADKLAPADADGGRWLTLRAVLPAGDQRQFIGRVQLIGRRGLSVVSDVDDTIKITEVGQRKAMLANTFLREFRAVPGMPETYRRLAGAGAAFHYVSGGPWQLYPSLAAFRAAAGFPPGTFEMKKFRLTDPKALSKLSTHEDAKRAAIGDLLNAFPQRHFVLFGDSGEQDPEIYGRLAREHPQAIVAVLIRHVTDEPADGPRFQQAFAELPRSRWTVFAAPREIDGLLTTLIAQYATH